MMRINFSKSVRVCFLVIFVFVQGNILAQDSVKISWRSAQDQPKEWYYSDQAIEIANNVLLYQHENGGWLKNINMADDLSEEDRQELEKERKQKVGTTIDNGATHTQLRYLAKVYTASKQEKYKSAFFKGMDFLLEAQYANGGWPQFYPIRQGYYEHITYNDGAMMGVMNLLRDIAKQCNQYTFVDKNRVKKAENAIDKGLEIILRTQVQVDGKLTIWCAQHDKNTLEPAKARAYELPSLSGNESTQIVEYLLNIENPSEEVKQSIRSAISWFQEHKVMGKKVKWTKDSEGRDRILVEDDNAGPLWGRFNDIETGKPIFVGRDGKIKYHLNDIERERRTGYNYIDDYAVNLLDKKYPKWAEKHGGK